MKLQIILIKKLSNQLESFGAAGGIRTPDLPVRSRTLYPTKLQLHTIILYMDLIKYSIEKIKNFQKLLIQKIKATK